MNLFDHEVQIEQHAVLGEAEPVFAEPVTLFSTEDSEELNNYCKEGCKNHPQTLLFLQFHFDQFECKA
jgi:hypothetical protein